MRVNQKSNQRKKLYPTRIYLENCPMYNNMYNEDLLKYVREWNSCLFGNCNAGKTSTNKKGHFGYILYWINKEWIANILSTPKLEDMGFCIT